MKDRRLFENKFSKYIQLDPWFTSIFHGRDSKLNLLCYKKGSCKNAEFISKHIVNFPTHSSIPLQFIKRIIMKNLHYIKSEMIK